VFGVGTGGAGLQQVSYLMGQQLCVPSVLSVADGRRQTLDMNIPAPSVRDRRGIVALIPRRPLALVARLGNRPKEHILPQPNQPVQRKHALDVALDRLPVQRTQTLC
jgi:hypothetical protein